MKESYYVINNNICTINYAYVQDGAVCYSDLVKGGRGAGFRGIVILQRYRVFDESPHLFRRLQPDFRGGPGLRQPRLTVEAESLCYVPSSGLNETLCYEFTCSAENGDRVLVYITPRPLWRADFDFAPIGQRYSGDVAFSRTLMPGPPPVKSDKAYSKGSPAAPVTAFRKTR